MVTCSPADSPLDLEANKRGILILDVNIVDSAGQNSQVEKALKSKVSVTIFDHNDEAVKSWSNLNQLPDKISLALGTYYVIVASEEVIPAEGNVISHYAKTDLIQINESQNQSIELIFKANFSPPGFSDFSF